MNFLKNIKSLQSEVSALPKYYHSHLWISAPASDGSSYLGISQFAKRYIVRFDRLNLHGFTKTNYGIANRFHIEAFVDETRQRRERHELQLSEQIEWGRFEIKKDEAFAILETIQFDVELRAPVDMRVIGYEYDVHWKSNILSAPYLFEVEALQPLQLTSLLDEQQYAQSRKMFMF